MRAIRHLWDLAVWAFGPAPPHSADCEGVIVPAPPMTARLFHVEGCTCRK